MMLKMPILILNQTEKQIIACGDDKILEILKIKLINLSIYME